MRITNGFPASLFAGLVVAIVLVLAPSATAYDPLEFPAAVDAANTYSVDKLTPPTNDGAHDFAVGGGQHGINFIAAEGIVCSNSDSNCVNEGFSAQSGPTGQNAQGRVSATFIVPQPYKLRGPVICLDVQANEAFILVMQEANAPGFPKGVPFLLHVIDMGNPINGTPPDMIANRGLDDFVPPPISGPLGYPCGYSAEVTPLIRGNIVVRDVT